MNATAEELDPPRKMPPLVDRVRSQRNPRTALVLPVLALASLASAFYEFGDFGNRKPVRQEKR